MRETLKDLQEKPLSNHVSGSARLILLVFELKVEFVITKRETKKNRPSYSGI